MDGRALSLCELRAPGAAQVLLNLAASRSWRVVAAALEAAGEEGGPPAAARRRQQLAGFAAQLQSTRCCMRFVRELGLATGPPRL
mmetsp:Transcript_1710/g.6681  ORF Transcript_1710/g.6681 Transcript_1710/m.6681 type:complete len:85 (+) Transcript_1710:361-615(+)